MKRTPKILKHAISVAGIKDTATKEALMKLVENQNALAEAVEAALAEMKKGGG